MPSPKGPSFRRYDPSQNVLLPTNLNEWLHENHLARIVFEVVDHLDLEPLLATYRNAEGGFPAFDPRLQLKVLLSGYSIGVVSSRRLEKATFEDLAVRWLPTD